MNIFQVSFKQDIGKELEVMSQILDETLKALDQVFKDLIGPNKSVVGRLGMTAEQVVRCAVLKQHRNLTHEEFPFHLPMMQNRGLSYRAPCFRNQTNQEEA